MVIAAMKLKDAYFLEESYDQPRQHIKKQRHYFANNYFVHLVKAIYCHPAYYIMRNAGLDEAQAGINIAGRNINNLEKEMATHSSILAWRIPWTEEPGGLQSMGLQRDGHD